MAACDTVTSCGFSPLQSCFQAMVFSTARWEGKEEILNEKEIFLAVTSKHFNPDVLFTHVLLSRDRRHHSLVRKHVHVDTAILKGRQSRWPWPSGVQSSSRRKLPVAVAGGQQAVDASVCDFAFILASPPFASSPSLTLLPKPAKGNSGFIPLLGPVYAAVPTWCFAAGIHREKITSVSIYWFFGCLEWGSLGKCLGVSCTWL